MLNYYDPFDCQVQPEENEKEYFEREKILEELAREQEEREA